MNRLIALLFIFFFTAIVYFGVSSNWTFRAKWYLDYFNPLATSLMQGRLDIDPPGQTYDLVHFQGKWYLPWGVLSALFLIPLQIAKGGFVPTVYLSIFFAALNVCIVYLMLLRMQREFFLGMKWWEVFLYTVLYAFGTMNFYVGTLGSVWHVDQIVSSFFGNTAVYIVFKKKRTDHDYFLAAVFLGVALAGRGTIVLLSVVPAILFLWEYLVQNKKSIFWAIRKGVLVFGGPVMVACAWFFTYNALRFGSPWEYGYNFILESPFLESMRRTYGIMSVYHMPTNLWHMLGEIPSLRIDPYITLGINLKGNSILFLTPPFLAIFLTQPIVKRAKRWYVDQYVLSLWSGVVLAMAPSLLIYSTGWMQFGYRYALDITLLLLLLVIFSMKGKINVLILLGIVWAIWMHILGITALQ